MPSCHRFVTEVDVTVPKPTEEHLRNATARLKQGRTRVYRALLTGFGCITIPQERATTQDQDRYIRLLHFLDKFRTATSTASPIPVLRRISSQTIINRLHPAGLLTRRPVRHNVPTAHHLAERHRWCQEHIRLRCAQ